MFSDIHSHLLFGVDDGPKTEEEMFELLDLSYRDGVRKLCLTPHFNVRFYGDNNSATERAFSVLCEYANDRYPDLKLFLGNELFYYQGACSHLGDGVCRTINKSKYVLVDFLSSEETYSILESVKALVSEGFIPIVAHAERYRKLTRNGLGNVTLLKEHGALVQVNAPSLIGKNGLRQKLLSRKLISAGLCDIISTDTHDAGERSTCMTKAAAYVQKHYGDTIRELLTYKNASDIFDGIHQTHNANN